MSGPHSINRRDPGKAGFMNWQEFKIKTLPFYIASVLMSRVVVSMQANSFILVITALALVNNIVFNRLLMVHYGAAGIALSTAIVYFVSTLVLFVFLQRRITRLIASAPSPEELL